MNAMNRNVTDLQDTKMPMRTAGAVLMTALVALAVIMSGSVATAKSAPESFAPLAERLLPAVVNISTTQNIKRTEGLQRPQLPQLPEGSPFEEFFKEFFDRQQRQGPRQRRATSLGSGFVIDSSGLIVTNNHVIDGADEITVIFHDDSRLAATVVGKDKKTDLALLRVKPAKPLSAVKFGNSDASRVGDWVVAIGNPFGLGGTVTAGIISARARNINAGPYDDFIQTDASINRGNSGGPMFNMDGEVVGINTAIYSPSGGSVGIGFAIPSNLAKPIINQLEKFGRARRGWLGVRIQTVTDELAESLGLEKARGALVANITENGPAEKSGLKVGDVILEFDGHEINEMRELPRAVAETPVGKKSKVVVWRQGKRKTVTVSLGEFPDEEKLAAASENSGSGKVNANSKALGLALAKITPEIRARYKLDDDVSGVIVLDVDEDSPAAEQGIRPGDIIRKVGRNQSSARSVKDIKKTVEQARKRKDKTLLFLIERNGNSRFVALQLDKPKG